MVTFFQKSSEISGRGSRRRAARPSATWWRQFRGGAIKACFPAQKRSVGFHFVSALSRRRSSQDRSRENNKKDIVVRNRRITGQPSYYPKGKRILSYVHYPEPQNFWWVLNRRETVVGEGELYRLAVSVLLKYFCINIIIIYHFNWVSSHYIFKGKVFRNVVYL